MSPSCHPLPPGDPSLTRTRTPIRIPPLPPGFPRRRRRGPWPPAAPPPQGPSALPGRPPLWDSPATLRALRFWIPASRRPCSPALATPLHSGRALTAGAVSGEIHTPHPTLYHFLTLLLTVSPARFLALGSSLRYLSPAPGCAFSSLRIPVQPSGPRACPPSSNQVSFKTVADTRRTWRGQPTTCRHVDAHVPPIPGASAPPLGWARNTFSPFCAPPRHLRPAQTSVLIPGSQGCRQIASTDSESQGPVLDSLPESITHPPPSPTPKGGPCLFTPKDPFDYSLPHPQPPF